MTLIPEIIGSSDTFPMIGNNIKAELVRPMPIVSLNSKGDLRAVKKQKHMVYSGWNHRIHRITKVVCN